MQDQTINDTAQRPLIDIRRRFIRNRKRQQTPPSSGKSKPTAPLSEAAEEAFEIIEFVGGTVALAGSAMQFFHNGTRLAKVQISGHSFTNQIWIISRSWWPAKRIAISRVLAELIWTLPLLPRSLLLARHSLHFLHHGLTTLTQLVESIGLRIQGIAWLTVFKSVARRSHGKFSLAHRTWNLHTTIAKDLHQFAESLS